ncbi:murein hydrolase activator EnvC family protein [Marinicrinis lubricantis]|uniref:Murein hydrolase activator EnvC family protein n=1 Tax=Marinicrinis lubricantis TaxID=2086470 RepID=A0ABW1IT51_9BACL
MKKAIIFFVLAALVVISVTSPNEGQAYTNVRDIDQQLEKLRQEQQAAKQRSEEAKNQMVELDSAIMEAETDLDALVAQIAEADQQLKTLQADITSTELELSTAEKNLQDAIDRVIARDQKLQSRLRIIYMNGSVSYMEVLLSSTSFTDFLDRFNGLKSLADQDKSILEQNKRDQEIIAQKKVEIENMLASLTESYEEMEQIHENLLVQEKKKEVMIASLQEQQAHLEHITEEEEQSLMAIAAQTSQLNAQKQEIIAQQQAAAAASRGNSGGTGGSGDFAYPLPQKYSKTSNYGYRIDPITGARQEFHKGVDVGAPGGTDVLAAASGTVIHADRWGGYGNVVIIEHSNGLWTLYAHMRSIAVSNGEQVSQGTKIGEVGTTGSSTGNHLHFEVRKNNGDEIVNPEDYLNF